MFASIFAYCKYAFNAHYLISVGQRSVALLMPKKFLYNNNIIEFAYTQCRDNCTDIPHTHYD